MHCNDTLKKSEIDYITAFNQVWMSFNCWYREDIGNHPVVCVQNCPFSSKSKSKKEHSDRCIIDYYKKQGKIKDEFLNLLNSAEYFMFQVDLYNLLRTLEKYSFVTGYGNLTQRHFKINNNNIKGRFYIGYYEKLPTPIYSISDTSKGKNQFFASTLEVIYQVRHRIFHGNYNPRDIYFQNIVENVYKVFYPIIDRVLESEEKEFFCIDASKKVNARGLLYQHTKKQKGIILLAGSMVSLKTTSSYDILQMQNQNRQLILQESANQKGDCFEMIHNRSFPSPSAAAGFCLGRISNGQVEWKNKHDRTIGDILNKK